MIFQNNIFPLKIIIGFIFLFLFFYCGSIFSQVTISHNPVGLDNLYSKREINTQLNSCEREPRDPLQNDDVIINYKTSPIFNKQECFADVIVNGVFYKTYKADFQYNYSGESYWKADIGKFMKGDSVNYILRVDYNDNAEQKSDSYGFVTYGWDYITCVKSAELSGNNLILHCASTNAHFSPEINISFDAGNSIKLSYAFSKEEKLKNEAALKCVFQKSIGKAALSNSKEILEINYSPFRLNLTSKNSGKKILKQYLFKDHSSIGFLNNNKDIFKVSENFYSPDDEMFFGFGERFNAINQRGNGIDNYVVNICKDQDLESYVPVPFYFTNKSYGFFLNTTYYSRFNLDTDKSNKCEIISNFGQKPGGKFEYYLFTEDKANKIISDYTSITGKPEKIPVWSLGPWMSANEWDKQVEIEAQMDSLKKYDIPSTVVIIEAWSDEETFYIFNDAAYRLNDGSKGFSLKDFKFSGRWPDPVGMINNLHKNNMRIVLWNIPVLKASRVQNLQRDADERYAIENDYVVKNPDGTPYRIPENTPWFGRSLLLDFSNQKAIDWWLNKRRYLLEEMKVDGFRPDGGEFVWGRDLIFANGKNGDEMRNLYPNLYIEAYNKLIKSINKDGIVFYRAGTFGAQKHPLVWNGDQSSSFPSFRAAIRSCLNFSLCGIPFVGYDIAGYDEEKNLTPELYKRSLAQAVFSPVMLFHSAYPGDSHLERTPWDIARRYNDPSTITVYKKFANVRFNIIPYLFTETEYSSETGYPLMRPLVTEYPLDTNAVRYETDYKLGRNLLIYPIVDPGTKKEIYLPEGEWFDFWSFKKYMGNKVYKFDVPVDEIPVFIKKGSITPLNLNKDFQVASGMNNDLNVYNNLAFVIFPDKNIEYEYHDYTNKSIKKIKLNSDGGQIKLDIPRFSENVSLIVKLSSFRNIEAVGNNFKPAAAWNEFLNASDKYYYSEQNQMLYIRINPADESNTIIIKSN